MTRPRGEARGGAGASTAEIPVRRRTVCPACREVIATGGVRCPRCFVALDRFAPLPQEEVSARIAEHDRRAAAGERAWLTRRNALIAAAALVALFIAYRAWDAWLRPPPTVPLASQRSLAVPPLPDAWPLAHGDLGSTRATSARPRIDGAPVWSRALGAGPSAPIVTDGTVVLAPLADGRLRALSAADGTPLWEERFPNPLWASPTLAGGLVVVTERSGRVAGYDARTGALRWAAQTQNLIAAPALVTDGVAYVYGQGGLTAFDAATGAELWSREIATPWAFVSPALDGDHVVVTTNDRLLVFNRHSGEQGYWYEFVRAQPFGAILDDGVAFGASWRFAGAFDVTSRRPWWEGWRVVWFQLARQGWLPLPPDPPARWVVHRPLTASRQAIPTGLPPALGPTALYLATAEGEVRAVARASGETLWRQQVGPISGSPTLTPDGLVVVQPGRLLLLDAATGAGAGERAFPDETLVGAVVTSATTYVTTASGRLIALR